MKKEKNKFRNILNKIFNKKGYKSKQQMRKMIEEMKNREEGASLPQDLAEQYRKYLEEKRNKEFEERFKKMKEIFEERQREVNQQKSYRESIRLPEDKLPDHEKAKEDAEESMIREQNRIISREIKHLIAEDEGGLRMSEKWLGDKVIVAYTKENGEEVVKEYTIEELLESARKRKQNSFTEE